MFIILIFSRKDLISEEKKEPLRGEYSFMEVRWKVDACSVTCSYLWTGKKHCLGLWELLFCLRVIIRISPGGWTGLAGESTKFFRIPSHFTFICKPLNGEFPIWSFTAEDFVLHKSHLKTTTNSLHKKSKFKFYSSIIFLIKNNLEQIRYDL